MTNLAYQTAVEELEAVMSPRVVSRSLKEGLRQHGRSPDTVDVATLEEILKGQVYRQLQVTMPVTEAKATVASIVERLREVGESKPAPPRGGLEDQAERIQRLQQSLKPYNLYFEWPEVQKLRAQLQLLESEHEAGREAGTLLADAEAQLEAVTQKLEDQLVLQAQELGELTEALEAVRSLGGPKVRRLESLVNHMRSAQEARQLAPAELERARKLARDLRRLMESSVYSEEAVEGGAGVDLEDEAAQDEEGLLDVSVEEEDVLDIDVGSLTPEASERLRLIDIAAEAQDLASLRKEHALLLEYRPDLAERFDALQAELDAERSVAQELAALRDALPAAAQAARDTLRAELEELSRELEAMPASVDNAEVRQATRVALGIIASTLPAAADVEHVRQLRDLAREQAEAQRRAEEALETQLRAQEDLVRRLQDTLVRYEAHSPAEDVQRLRAELESLRLAHENRTLVPEVMASVRQAEERLARELAERATEESERRRARIESMRAQLLAVPATATLGDRLDAALREVDRLLEEHVGSEAASALLLDEEMGPQLPLDAAHADFEALESLIAAIRNEAVVSVRRRLERLAEKAGEIASVSFAERIQAAMTDLEDGVFPDLAGLEVELDRASEAARTHQLGELHRLGREAQTYASLDFPEVEELLDLLASERQQLADGGHARRLGEAAILLDRVESRVEQRVASVPQRLDAALARFEEVAKLNSDDVATVRRILQHLDSQREALGRVSVGLRLQLEASLTQAEQLLSSLEEEYEATRLIADQLVAGGLLDGVLGALGGLGTPEQARQAHDPRELAERYADTPGVQSVSVLSPEGETLAGEAPSGEALAAITALRQAAGALVDDEAGGVLVVTAGSSEDHVVAAFAPELTVALRVDSAALAPVVSGRLRRDLAGD